MNKEQRTQKKSNSSFFIESEPNRKKNLESNKQITNNMIHRKSIHIWAFRIIGTSYFSIRVLYFTSLNWFSFFWCQFSFQFFFSFYVPIWQQIDFFFISFCRSFVIFFFFIWFAQTKLQTKNECFVSSYFIFWQKFKSG